MSTLHLAANMPQQIIQINYGYSGDMPAEREAYKEEKEEIAEGIAEFPGLQWKIWPFNKDRKEGGGIYLFEDEESAEEYKTSDYVEVLREEDKYEDIEESSSNSMRSCLKSQEAGRRSRSTRFRQQPAINSISTSNNELRT